MRTWTVVVPFVGTWLTANPRRQGAWWERSRSVRDWRAATAISARAAKLPVGVECPVSIHAVCRYVGRKPVRDTPNLYPTIKACIDGLTPQRVIRRGAKVTAVPGYGFLVDDSDKQIPTMPTWELVATLLQPCVELTITEVS